MDEVDGLLIGKTPYSLKLFLISVFFFTSIFINSMRMDLFIFILELRARLGVFETMI